jgi:hypothetical protein
VKRRLITSGFIVVILGVAATGAAAQHPASRSSSCVATITSFEATQLAPGAVGDEVSGLAGTPGLGRRLVNPLARAHLGSIEGCLAVD